MHVCNNFKAHKHKAGSSHGMRRHQFFLLCVFWFRVQGVLHDNVLNVVSVSCYSSSFLVEKCLLNEYTALARSKEHIYRRI